MGREKYRHHLIKNNIPAYLESNHYLFSYVPIIKKVFENYKIIHVVRDGRDTVRSFHKRNLYRYDKWRLNPKLFDDDPFRDEWDDFNRFEKICWYWNKKNSIISNQIQGDKNSITIRFEDIFLEKHYYKGLKNLLDFTDLKPSDLKIRDFSHLLMNKRNTKKKYDLPRWENWSQEQKKSFTRICEDHMKLYGYF